MDDRDADRLELLDRIAKRIPELDLDQQEIEWRTLDDGAEALLINGGGIDGADGAYFATTGRTYTRSDLWPRSSTATSAAS